MKLKISEFGQEQLDKWKKQGFLILKSKDVFDKNDLDCFLASVNEVESYPEEPGKWMMYFEKSEIDGSRIINRIENFLPYNEDLNELVNGKEIIKLLSQLFGEPAILYKEKINFKKPGGTGFKPHQDAQAGWDMYGHTIHISVAISIDSSDKSNGCLEFVSGKHKNGLIGPMWDELPESIVNELEWEPIFTEPGDIIFFDSYTPHRSGPNLTDKPRRLMYITYNKSSEGDFREKYYIDKRKNFPPDCEREPGKNYEYKI